MARISSGSDRSKPDGAIATRRQFHRVTAIATADVEQAVIRRAFQGTEQVIDFALGLLGGQNGGV